MSLILIALYSGWQRVKEGPVRVQSANSRRSVGGERDERREEAVTQVGFSNVPSPGCECHVANGN